VLLSLGGVFVTLGVVILAMMLSGRTMELGSGFVVFRCFSVGLVGYFISL